ncbi:MAG: protein-L-isoaspartate(D-aspartate) O-methyltransferase, partial [Syntrophaceae bacterium]|nr:protein-L-isoaspartate(D-aspartate) O-methyltransferase [Syntrophaceae bacterium]
LGVGIFKTPSIVAASAESEGMVLLFWLVGGTASLIGALCYAELMSADPHAGGDYHYLHRAFGPVPSFLYAWARITIIQTGFIAMVAFIIGDYASEIFSLGRFSHSIYAALAIVLLTAVNIAGIQRGKWTQKILLAGILIGLITVSAIGFLMASPQTGFPEGKVIPEKKELGKALIFVLLTYGGWNEASFLSAEVRSGRRNLLKVLLYSIGTVTGVYLLVNIALLKSLGLSGMASSSAVIAEMMKKTLGIPAGDLVSLLILFTAASTMNAAIITGARSCYALGKDFPFLGFLGRWQGLRETPVNALLLQGGVALVLVVLGTGTPDGFVLMVEYTAPVFWLFFLMVAVSLFWMRHKYPNEKRPFRVPLYPLTPLVFCAICLFMLYSSLAFTGRGSLIGVGVLLSGIPLMIIQKTRQTQKKSLLIFIAVICLSLSALNCRADVDAEKDYAWKRERMVAEQIEARGIRNPKVLKAMRTVQRHQFVPVELRTMAYGDYPLPIGEGQTISQPYIVALMTEVIKPGPDMKVLEIGTGSGYQAAVLAELCKSVYSIEIVEILGRRAERILSGLYKNVHIKIGDGYKGWPEAAPFDAIIVTCAPTKVPQPLKDQLKEGGRMVIPVGGAWAQQLIVLIKKGSRLTQQAIIDVRFVPMVNPQGGKY